MLAIRAGNPKGSRYKVMLKKIVPLGEGATMLHVLPTKMICSKCGSEKIVAPCNEDKVVGTGALIKHRNNIFEIGKVAVTKKFQGNGIGEKLIRMILDRAHDIGVKELYLQTSPTLKAANQLYNKFGFRKTGKNPFDKIKFNRPTFTMKLTLE